MTNIAKENCNVQLRLVVVLRITKTLDRGGGENPETIGIQMPIG